MKRFLFFLIFANFLPVSIFSQNKISEITEFQWNQNKETWEFFSVDTWDYNEAGQEILYVHSDDNFSDFIPYNQSSVKTKYDDHGNIVEEERIYLGQDPFSTGSDIWSKHLYTYKFNSENELEESTLVSTHSGNPFDYYTKDVFEKDATENRFTKKGYRKNDGSDIWILVSRQDDFFDDNGCLTKQTSAEFEEDGTRYNYRWWEMTYTDDCQVLTHEYSIWDESLGELIPFRRYIYIYLDNGKKSIITSEVFEADIADWELRNIIEIDFDEEGREYRNFRETFRPTYTDTVLTETTYNAMGETHTFRRFETRHNINDDPLYQTRLDSFGYHYDADDNLLTFEMHVYSYSNPVYIYTTNYKYYCNGQLKEELAGGEYAQSKKIYRYHGGVNCPLEEHQRPLILFPNPSDGNFTIHSNLFASADATIQVFTILGKEVFSKKVNEATYLYNLDLPAGLKGQFIVTVSNEEGRESQMLMVQ